MKCRKPVLCSPAPVLWQPPPLAAPVHAGIPEMPEAHPPAMWGMHAEVGQEMGLRSEHGVGDGRAAPILTAVPCGMRPLWSLQLGALTHPHHIPIPTNCSLQVTSLTPPARSLHITALCTWQLIAECWGKGPYAKAACLRHLLTNKITCPPSKRKVLICG